MSLINNLEKPSLYDHPVAKFELVETHISQVLLTGQFVYKIKKPVNFGFLDFSTLEKRHFYCNEELRLNRRLAPDLYLEVLPITGSEEQPEFNGSGPVIEYAVKMQQFPQSAQLDRVLSNHGLDNAIMDQLASKVASFHMLLEPANNDSDYGDAQHIQQPMLENFEQIHGCIDNTHTNAQLNNLENWTHQQLTLLTGDIQLRKQQGFVRECHGDMHLRNIALWKDEIIIFDCLEFNKNLYTIDVMSEIAFVVMDLESRNQYELAQRFLNSYLEITGDYEGLSLFRLYKVYRALVRAKVNALRLKQEQSDTQEYDQVFIEFQQYLNLAEEYTCPVNPCLLINHGLSGSGKSVGTRTITEKYPAIQVRSDVERKRLFHNMQKHDSEVMLMQGLYSPEATEKTYARLVEIAKYLLAAGYSVVIDAANLKQQQRQLFRELANSMQFPFVILTYDAPVVTLRQRVEQRRQQGKDYSDATLDVLEHQLKNRQPLSGDEKSISIVIDTSESIDANSIAKQITTVSNRYHRPV